MPEASRGSVIAVRAFNVEVALAADKASDVRIAEMRLRWWLGVVGKKQLQVPLFMSLCNNTLLMWKLRADHFSWFPCLVDVAL